MVTYVELAYERDVYLFNVDDDSKFSLHQAVGCSSKKILKYMGKVFGAQ